MKGAEALLRTLAKGGVEVCFTNPGTSEMQFVAALDNVPEMRGVLTLFEGVASGAGDGYARMAGKPAATLLHLGPGMANGLANLHNANRARVPLVNVVGDHATTHRQYDAPLTSDIARYASQVSHWVRSVSHVQTIGSDAAAAVAAARQAPGRIATLITPADCTWQEGATPGSVVEPPVPGRVDETAIAAAAAALRSGETAMLLLAGAALQEAALVDAGRIAAGTGARIAAPTFFARLPRGAGRVALERLPYPIDQAVEFMDGVRHLILIGADAPVSFFAYPGQPSWLTPDGAHLHVLALPEHDLPDALARLADAVDAPAAPQYQVQQPLDLPVGALTPEGVCQAVASLLPEQCIVVEEALSSMMPAWHATAASAPHDWLVLTGGAIGCGMPVSVGAAVACPDRRVLNLQADGSAAYTLQALWTQAREGLDVTTVLYANSAYRILEIEYERMGDGEQPGPCAQRLMSLDDPSMDWTLLARGMGVPATRARTAEEFNAALAQSLSTPGPSVIEAMI